MPTILSHRDPYYHKRHQSSVANRSVDFGRSQKKENPIGINSFRKPRIGVAIILVKAIQIDSAESVPTLPPRRQSCPVRRSFVDRKAQVLLKKEIYVMNRSSRLGWNAFIVPRARGISLVFCSRDFYFDPTGNAGNPNN
jgi:hypothetical protein